MAEFLLIHGSCHGAWCWRDVLPFLHAAGHGARAIDLPGHGADDTPLDEVTLDGYARAIVGAITTPAIVVGHSMAGFPISLAADLAPDAIAKLVFLCAYVPANGQSLADMRRAWPDQPLLPAIRMAEDKQSFSFAPEMLADRFYHDCPPGTVEYARAHLTPQPVAPQATPLALGPGYAAAEKHYIRCLEDRAIPPAYQVRMSADFPHGRVSTLTTSHSPFFAAPEALAARLIEIMGQP
jgi:pimeloyl-ACP methyl ester carboxylesterase